jgi:hypothetical protein
MQTSVELGTFDSYKVFRGLELLALSGMQGGPSQLGRIEGAV